MFARGLRTLQWRGSDPNGDALRYTVQVKHESGGAWLTVDEELEASAFSLLLRWIEDHDYAVAGPTREVYLRFGADQVGYSLPDGYLAERDEEYVTELQVPVAIIGS